MMSSIDGRLEHSDAWTTFTSPSRQSQHINIHDDHSSSIRLHRSSWLSDPGYTLGVRRIFNSEDYLQETAKRTVS